MNDRTRTTHRNGFMDMLSTVLERLGALLSEGNHRQLIVRNEGNRTLLRLPLTVAVLLGLFLLWKATTLVVIAFIVALVLKVQFVVTHDTTKGPPRGT